MNKLILTIGTHADVFAENTDEAGIKNSKTICETKAALTA